MRKWEVGHNFYVVSHNSHGVAIGVGKWEVTNVGRTYIYGCKVVNQWKTEHKFEKDKVFETIDDACEAIYVSLQKSEIKKQFTSHKLSELLQDAQREDVDSLSLAMRKLGFDI